MTKFDDLVSDVMRQSRCSLKVFGPMQAPDRVEIEFHGPCARIPAHKNQRIHGTNIIRPEAKAVLVAMTKLIRQAVPPNYTLQFPKAEQVLCFVHCGNRDGRSFDVDNVITTVKDWLEPSFIRKRERGWGIGLVENDRYVKGDGDIKGPGFESAMIVVVPRRGEVESMYNKYTNFILTQAGL